MYTEMPNYRAGISVDMPTAHWHCITLKREVLASASPARRGPPPAAGPASLRGGTGGWPRAGQLRLPA
jgi:hypothetical protein